MLILRFFYYFNNIFDYNNDVSRTIVLCVAKIANMFDVNFKSIQIARIDISIECKHKSRFVTELKRAVFSTVFSFATNIF